MSDGQIVNTSVVEVIPTKHDFKEWEFDWTIPRKNGYTIRGIKADGDSRIQGLIALKPDSNNYAVKIDIVEAAPFNNPHNPAFSSKEYSGVGGHLFAKAVRESFKQGFGGYVYYSATVNLDLQKKIKGVIQAKGSRENKELEILRQFFYSFEFGDIQQLLFSPSWTTVETRKRETFLSENPDLSVFSDQQLREAFSNFTPKSDWERFFSDKIDVSEIEQVIEEIRKYRNSAAHFKSFSKKDYSDCSLLIQKLNRAVLNAIRITEEKDFLTRT